MFDLVVYHLRLLDSWETGDLFVIGQISQMRAIRGLLCRVIRQRWQEGKMCAVRGHLLGCRFMNFRSTPAVSGDLSEVADASPGITTEDLARDLEAVASKQ